MSRTITLALLVLVPLTTAAAAAATCDGVDVAITHVGVTNVTTNGTVNRYTITGTLTNLGTRAQSSNILQFVNISQYGQKLDARSVPPLAPGQSHSFTWEWQRSSDAGRGTSTIDFRFAIQPPVPAGQAECNTANDHYTLSL
jgi:hypothetical protein